MSSANTLLLRRTALAASTISSKVPVGSRQILVVDSSSSCWNRHLNVTNKRGVGHNKKEFFSTSKDLTRAGSNAITSSDGVVAVPIDFDAASRVEGQESQIVTVDLEPGNVLRAESGAMLYMTDGVDMETTTGGGLSAGFKRMLTGQNLMISDFRYNGAEGTKGQVALGTDFPSKIIRLSVDEYGGKIVCQKGALLCASHTIDIEMEFAKKMTTGFFGGEGFVLQSLTGTGDVFVKAGGTLIRRELKEEETLRVSSGCLVGFSDGVDFDVQMLKGVKNVIFGGEGLFVTQLKGPGTVWLQGQPPQRMISEIASRVPSGGGVGLGVPIMGMGGGGDGGEGGDAAEDLSSDDADGFAAAEEAVENDKAYATASSVAGNESPIDSESQSALFGDAINEEPGVEGQSSFQGDNEFASSADESSFSSDGNVDFNDNGSFADGTTFSTHDESPTTESSEEGGGDLLSSIWSVFSDDD
eukprot:CAMPEP_0116067402 /NCGR_PEP_ID=MMETSP0322-20121206/10983_1 /TAXON_ID=163516 /ORGANISM="Leptocylindrus danicus var. apora, Strain B651" /LENGTH=470 /DNA_ID=CAMNT_0003554193 /DNA_START=42 /DNA_END=1454 /DNA_ORIENTATION=-